MHDIWENGSDIVRLTHHHYVLDYREYWHNSLGIQSFRCDIVYNLWLFGMNEYNIKQIFEKYLKLCVVFLKGAYM